MRGCMGVGELADCHFSALTITTLSGLTCTVRVHCQSCLRALFAIDTDREDPDVARFNATSIADGAVHALPLAHTRAASCPCCP